MTRAAKARKRAPTAPALHWDDVIPRVRAWAEKNGVTLDYTAKSRLVALVLRIVREDRGRRA